MGVKTAKKKKMIALVGKHLSKSLLAQKPDLQLRERIQIKTAISKSFVADWVAVDRKAADELVEEAVIRSESIPSRAAPYLGNLILLEKPDFDMLPPAQSFFKNIAWTHTPANWARDDLMEILRSPDAKTRIVGGMVNVRRNTLTIYRGDLRALTVSLSVFKPTSDGVRIDPTRFAVGDGGIWISLGEFEASTEMVLYMADPEFRRKLNAKRKAEERTFGAKFAAITNTERVAAE